MGGSTVALFGRVGGGIYTKAADVGADLVGKVVHGIPEDDPRNPATIADNVGDNVGDVAGMGADLFGSFAESTCAALVIATQCDDLRNAGWGAICFPMTITSVGILVSLLTSFVATHIYPVTTQARIELALRLQLIISTVTHPIIPSHTPPSTTNNQPSFHVKTPKEHHPLSLSTPLSLTPSAFHTLLILLFSLITFLPPSSPPFLLPQGLNDSLHHRGC